MYDFIFHKGPVTIFSQTQISNGRFELLVLILTLSKGSTLTTASYFLFPYSFCFVDSPLNGNGSAGAKLPRT